MISNPANLQSCPRHRGIFFDRDGVLNKVVMRQDVVGSPRHLSEFIIFPEISPILHSARKKGTVVIITNQPDLGHGLLDPTTLEQMHSQLIGAAPGSISLVLCEGSNLPNHPRRKPQPLMLLEAAQKLSLSLECSWIIGDSIKDIEAGEQAGARTVLLETNYNKSIHGRGEVNLQNHTELLVWLENLT